MAKVLVIGSPGSGKTYISQKMKEKGYPAYDADAIPGIHQLRHRITGELKDKNSVIPDDWYVNYELHSDVDVVKSFLANRRDVYIFGLHENVFDLMRLFDRVFYLDLPVEKIPERLSQTDRENLYGKSREQQKLIADWLPGYTKEVRAHNIPFIDATLSAEEIIQLITSP